MWKCKKCGWFPSPIGVIFSLIGEIRIHKTNTKINIVSVSYRSYILSYEMRIPENIKLIIAQFVSVSYWSYILSYLMEDLYFKSEEAKMFPSPIGVIFSLISEMYFLRSI